MDKVDKIILYILCCLITLFTIFLMIIYFKSNVLKSYPFYFNIYFCIIITLNNGIRLIPSKKDENSDDPSLPCIIQAFVLSTFDKLFVASISAFCIINYIIMVRTKLYSEYTLRIYVISIVVGIIISVVLTIIFYTKGISVSNLKDSVCYVKTNTALKRILDSVYNGVLLFINLFCITRILFQITRIMKDSELNNNAQKRKNMKRHFWRFIICFFLNIITYVYIILLINKKVSFGAHQVKDILYVILCLINEIFFSIHEETYKEMMRILTCNKNDKYKNSEDTSDKDKLKEEEEEQEETDD